MLISFHCWQEPDQDFQKSVPKLKKQHQDTPPVLQILVYFDYLRVMILKWSVSEVRWGNAEVVLSVILVQHFSQGEFSLCSIFKNRVTYSGNCIFISVLNLDRYVFIWTLSFISTMFASKMLHSRSATPVISNSPVFYMKEKKILLYFVYPRAHKLFQEKIRELLLWDVRSTKFSFL